MKNKKNNKDKKNSWLNKIIDNSLDILCITIEHIISMLFILILIVLLMYKFQEIDLLNTILVGIFSGIIASIFIQSKIDLRECKKDTFKLLLLWKDLFFLELDEPKFSNKDLNAEKANYINSKYIIIAEVNNILNNKYSFEIFKCSFDKTIIKFISKLEMQLGPYNSTDIGIPYAYNIIRCLVSNLCTINNEKCSYADTIGHIIRACINTHAPFNRKKYIFKKSGIKNKDEFDKIIKSIEYMNNSLLHNKLESAAFPFFKTLDTLNNEINQILNNDNTIKLSIKELKKGVNKLKKANEKLDTINNKLQAIELIVQNKK